MCIVFRKAMEAKVVRMGDGGISGVSNWKQSICVTCKCSDEVRMCGQKKRGCQKLASRAKVWSALFQNQINYDLNVSASPNISQ